MQYLLTETEYKSLQDAANNSTPNITLKYKCIQLACSIPITLDWGIWKMKPTPWGCPDAIKLLTKSQYDKLMDASDSPEEDAPHYNKYCNECPVKTICPSNKSIIK